MSEDNFDEAELITERHLVEGEIVTEFNESSSLRAEALLITNYVENLLKDCIVYLMRANKARGIQREIILKILVERNVINQALSQDIDRIFKIRDQFGHTMRISIVKERVEPVIDSMNITPTLRERNATWDTFQVDEKLSKVSLSIILMLNEAFANLVADNTVRTKNQENNGK